MRQAFTTRQRASRTVLLAAGLFLLSASVWAQVQKDACDLNADGVDNAADVSLAVNMDIGLVPCTANILALATCNVVVVQRVTNAALNGLCATNANPHTVTLNWAASTTPNVSYNIYRASTSGGPYIKIGLVGVGVVTYTDSTALAGQTYYYVARAVDSTNTESANSNEAKAVVPFP